MATKIPALLKIVKDEERANTLAAACGAKVGYLRLIAYGFGTPSAKLAKRIAEHTSIPRTVLRPDIFGKGA